MVQIIAGERGRGKTKQLLEKANEMVHNAQGNMVYIDKSSQNMYGLHKSIRLINMAEYEIDSPDAFRGFIYGIISQDYDLETIFLDSFLKLANLEGQEITSIIDDLEKIGNKKNITFVLSISMKVEDLPANAKNLVI